MKRSMRTALRTLTAAAGAALLLALLPASPAAAYSPGDVEAYAYSIGYPGVSDMMEMAWEEYNSGNYTQADMDKACDQAMSELRAWAAERDAAAQNELIGNTDSSTGADSAAQNSTAQPEPTDEPDSGETAAAENPDAAAQDNTEEMTDKAFAKLSMEEKKAYVASLPESERQSFVDSLSNEAKNSILKQLSTDKQIAFIAKMADSGDILGLNYSVDTVEDGTIKVSARNADGDLIGVSVMGNEVEKTGKPYTLPIAVSGAMILLSAGGFLLLARKQAGEK